MAKGAKKYGILEMTKPCRRGAFMGYLLTCDDGIFYFEDLDDAIEYGEQNCPHGYNIDVTYD